jgi:hypothetical protein
MESVETLERKEKKNQFWAIQHEFEYVGPTLLKKNPFGAGWGLQPTLRWGGLLFVCLFVCVCVCERERVCVCV